MQVENFLTVDEASKILKVHPHTIRSAIKSGRIQAFRPGIGKRSPYRISEAEIGRIRVMSFDETIKGLNSYED